MYLHTNDSNRSIMLRFHERRDVSMLLDKIKGVDPDTSNPDPDPGNHSNPDPDPGCL